MTMCVFGVTENKSLAKIFEATCGRVTLRGLRICAHRHTARTRAHLPACLAACTHAPRCITGYRNIYIGSGAQPKTLEGAKLQFAGRAPVVTRGLFCRAWGTTPLRENEDGTGASEAGPTSSLQMTDHPHVVAGVSTLSLGGGGS